MPSQLPRLTIRVPRELRKRWSEKIGPETPGAAVVRLIRQEVATAPSYESAEQSARRFAERVVHLLNNDPKWAIEIVRTALPRGRVDSLLLDRMLHYEPSKRESALRFAPTIAARMRWLVESKRLRVNLMLDAGSGVLSIAQALWPLFKDFPSEVLDRISIYTNNLSVAEEYAEQCGLGTFGTRRTVKCYLLGGQIDHTYAAVTGDETKRAVDTVYAEASTKTHKNIAIVSGNYIRLNPRTPNPWPIPLIRGDGQLDVKSALVSAGAHELYVACGAIAKVFVADNVDANTAILGSDFRQHKPYADVKVPREKQSAMKLIAVTRESANSLLHKHSGRIKSLLGGSPVNSYNSDFEEMGHFLFNYDEDVARLTDEAQIRHEFPHIFPDMREALRDYFSIDTDSINVGSAFWDALETERLNRNNKR